MVFGSRRTGQVVKPVAGQSRGRFTGPKVVVLAPALSGAATRGDTADMAMFIVSQFGDRAGHEAPAWTVRDE